MSEKPGAAKLAEISEKSKKTAGESKECSPKKKEQSPSKKPVEDTKKTMKKIVEVRETETTQSGKTTPTVSTSSKPESLKSTEKPCEPKAAIESKVPKSETKISSTKPESPKSAEKSCEPEAAIESKMPKSETKISSTKPESPKSAEKPCEPEAATESKVPKSETKISSTKPESPKSAEKPCEPEAAIESKMLKSETKISSTKPESPKSAEKPCELEAATESKMPKSETKISMKPESPKVCPMQKTTKLVSLYKPESEHTDVTEIDHTLTCSKIEEPYKLPEVYLAPKVTAFDIFTSDKPEDPKTSEVCLVSATAPFEISTSYKPEDLKVPEVYLVPSTTSSEMYTTDKPECLKASEVCQISKGISKMLISSKSEDCKIPEKSQESTTMPKISTTTQVEISIPEVRQTVKTTSDVSTSIFTKPEIEIPKVTKMLFKKLCETSIDKTEEPEIPEVRRTRSMSKIANKTVESENPEIRRTHSTASQIPVPIKFEDLEDIETPETSSNILKISTSIKSEEKSEANVAKDMKDDDSELFTKKRKTSFLEDTKSDDNKDEKPIPIEKDPSENAVLRRKIWPQISAPNFTLRPLVLATQELVPSLPNELFEVLAEMIEVVTQRPVVLSHECRLDRHISAEITDIAILSANEASFEGTLLPVTFVFKHHLNKNKSSGVYADVVISNDHPLHVDSITDLRGYKCAITSKRGMHSAYDLLINYLRTKGENLRIFGNIHGARTQLEVLEMVASRQADVGIVESPVITCHKYRVPGINSVRILTSLGPLPPYRIKIKKSLEDDLATNLTKYLLAANNDKEWMERLQLYGVIGFTENSPYYYCRSDKTQTTRGVPYY